MFNMNEKRKCEKCKLLIDSDLDTCPYCGYPQEKIEVNKEEIKSEEIKEEKIKSKSFFSFPSRVVILDNYKNLTLFLLGFLGMQILSVIIVFLMQALNLYVTSFSTVGSAIINFSVYFTMFGIMLLVLNEDCAKLFKDFLNKRTYLYGFSYGFMLIVLSSLVTNIMYLLFQTTDSNANQQSIVSITDSYPILSIIVFGLIGPICEEFCYRVGLFSAINKRYNLPVSYIITMVVFAFIHFDYTALFSGDGGRIATEFINLPSYLVAGLTLTYVYHKEGFGPSTIAHITNNLVSIIISIILY